MRQFIHTALLFAVIICLCTYIATPIHAQTTTTPATAAPVEAKLDEKLDTQATTAPTEPRPTDRRAPNDEALSRSEGRRGMEREISDTDVDRAMVMDMMLPRLTEEQFHDVVMAEYQHYLRLIHTNPEFAKQQRRAFARFQRARHSDDDMSAEAMEEGDSEWDAQQDRHAFARFQQAQEVDEEMDDEGIHSEGEADEGEDIDMDSEADDNEFEAQQFGLFGGFGKKGLGFGKKGFGKKGFGFGFGKKPFGFGFGGFF